MKPPLRLVHPHLLASIALAATATQASAQEQTAKLVKDANRTLEYLSSGTRWAQPIAQGAVFTRDTLAHGTELWTSDGTVKGSRLLKDLTPGPGSTPFGSAIHFGPDAGAASGSQAKVAFVLDRTITGSEVWITDGTDAGTQRIFTSAAIEDLGNIQLLAGTTSGFFFRENDSTETPPSAVWFSDGTEAGTWLLNPVSGNTRERFSYPGSSFVTSGEWCYFAANSDEVWRSDGTPAGTTKIADLSPGFLGSLQVAGDRLFIIASEDANRRALWTCALDGSGLTKLGPPDGISWGSLLSMATIGDRVFFSIVSSPENTRQLWTSDGTTAGTRHLPLIVPAGETLPEVYNDLVSWKGAIYFSAGNDEHARQLWRTDGTEAGTARFATLPEDITSFSPYAWRENADALYFRVGNASDAQRLWETRGDAATTLLVSKAPSSPHNVAASPSALFFAADPVSAEPGLFRLRGGKSSAVTRLTKPEKINGDGIPDHFSAAPPFEMLDGSLLEFVLNEKGHELWSMTPDGKKSRSIWKGTKEYSLISFAAITSGGAIFSYATDHGNDQTTQQVWVTDGTRKGTRMLGEHGSGIDDAFIYKFVTVGGTCFYTTTNDADPTKSSLWKTDGTVAGTVQVLAADGTSAFSSADEIVAFGDGIAFLSTGSDSKTSLWLSDGTTAGTVLVKKDWYGSNNFNGQTGRDAANLSVVGGKLHFIAFNAGKQLLWQSDGTTAGTVEVTPATAFENTFPVIDLGGVAIFQAHLPSEDYNSIQWWRHSGTETRPVLDSANGMRIYSNLDSTHAVAGSHLFYAGAEENDAELWVTDGTDAGTRRVKDIIPGPIGSGPHGFYAVGDVVYFTASDLEHGEELWRSDGTEAGTVLVADVEPGPLGSGIADLKAMGGKLYFTAKRRATGRELHSIDLPDQP